jgi:epoxide hydrolase-like predicted phosphatase
MTSRAVFFDLGGVILRTEQPAPRTNLAQSLGLTYAEIDKLVFENDSSRQASLGLISEDQHWQNVARSLDLPEDRVEYLRTEFFAGDRLDLELVDLMRSLRPAIRVGLISNAWNGMRDWITKQNFADAFDDMVISAEIGIAKPDVRIYQAAMQNLHVIPPESVFLDDTLRNVEAARNIGMHAIHFVQPGQAVAELKTLLAV